MPGVSPSKAEVKIQQGVPTTVMAVKPKYYLTGKIVIGPKKAIKLPDAA